MKTYRIKAARESEELLVLEILQNLERKGTIVFEEEQPDAAHNRPKAATPATEEQVQEIIASKKSSRPADEVVIYPEFEYELKEIEAQGEQP